MSNAWWGSSRGTLSSRVVTIADFPRQDSLHQPTIQYVSSSEEEDDSDWENPWTSGNGRRLGDSTEDGVSSANNRGRSSREQRARLRSEQSQTTSMEADDSLESGDSSEGNSDDYDSDRIPLDSAPRRSSKRSKPRRATSKRGRPRSYATEEGGVTVILTSSKRASSSSSSSSHIVERGAISKAVRQSSPGKWARRDRDRGWLAPLRTPFDREWAQLDSQVEHQYCPQVGDRVVYFSQGHAELLSFFAEQAAPPWLSFANDHWPVVECIVTELHYDFPSSVEHRRCRSVVANVTLAVQRVPSKCSITSHGSMVVDFIAPRPSTRHSSVQNIVFNVKIRNCDVPDFIVPWHTFERALRVQWREGMRIMVEVKEPQPSSLEGGSEDVAKWVTYPAVVVGLSSSHDEWRDSPWDALQIQWVDDSVNSPLHSSSSAVDAEVNDYRVGPWEATPVLSESSDLSRALKSGRYDAPRLSQDVAAAIDKAINELMDTESDEFSPFEFEVDSEVFPEYYTTVTFNTNYLLIF